MFKKSALIICRNNLSKAPRFLMEVEALSSEYKILATGIASEEDSNYVFIPLHSSIKEKNTSINFHFKYYYLFRKIISLFIRIINYKNINADKISFKKNFKTLNKLEYHIVIVHHFIDLPLAVKLAKSKKVKLIFNAHEYYPLEFDNDTNWMNSTHLNYMKIANKYLKHVDICFCVANLIAIKYNQEFNLKSEVITNAKLFHDLKPSVIIAGNKIKLIHHGVALRNRQIELMINMMSYLSDDFTLDLILVPGDLEYIAELRELSKKYINISFKDIMPTSQIIDALNKYDIGVYILPPNNFNDKNALPNKFFEFIQARLAIAISPSPEMATLVNKYDLGVVADNFTGESLAEKIKELSIEKIMYFKNNCNQHAVDLCVEKNWELIKGTVDTLIS